MADASLRALEELRRVLEFPAQISDAQIPSEWPSVNCDNHGHEQRHEDDWRCPDCFSTWWAVNDEEQPAEYHVQAFIFGALLVEQEGGA